MILKCNTVSCEMYNIEFEMLDDGTGIQCGGGCGNILRENDSDHPNYPVLPESEPSATLEELVEQRVNQKLRELGLLLDDEES